MSWSSGKDSAYTLYELRKNSEIEVVGLLTTINETHQRVAMHAVREELLVEQARELELPLELVKIPYGCQNELYEARMHEAIDRAINKGVNCIAFGDLFLEDIRHYREKMLSGKSISPLFPIWKRPTNSLAREMIASGLKAIITCVDPKKLSPTFAGREFSASFLDDLPEGIDPCGENGEFHSFVYDSPLFKNPLSVQLGEVIERDGFVFADVLNA